MSINNLSFSLLHYEPNSTSLLISPRPAFLDGSCYSSRTQSIPYGPINLLDSPFRISDSTCSRLSVLKPCEPPDLVYCSRCEWDCNLTKNPLELVRSCGSGRSQVSKQGCQPDILGFLDGFLQMGIEIEWDEGDAYFSGCKDCRSKDGVCGFNSSDPSKHFLCFPPQISRPWIRQRSPHPVALMSVVFLFLFFLVAVLMSTIIFRSRRKSPSKFEDPTIVYLQRHRSNNLLPPLFSFEELQLATNNFHPKRKIGDGGFGSVYLGHLRDNRSVAIKYLHQHHPTNASAANALSTKSFCNEILILSSLNHPNLVKLHGYCSDTRGLLLVYEYVPNGTLADHLHGNKRSFKKGHLSWQVRVDLALQVAMAMEYLHFSVVPPIVHRDITSSNIFVDGEMRVKVGDFGMCRSLVCSSESVWTGPQGTPGYLDPDYHRSFRLTEKSDVYSFGVVLLELITGMRPVDERREKREMALVDMVISRIQMGRLEEVVDPVFAVEAMGGVEAAAELAFRCVAAERDDRPDAGEVERELRRIRGRTRGAVGMGGSSNAANVGAPDVGPPTVMGI